MELLGLLSPRSYIKHAIADSFERKREERLATQQREGINNVFASEGYKKFIEANPNMADEFGLWGAWAAQPGQASVANSALIRGMSHQWNLDAMDYQLNRNKEYKRYSADVDFGLFRDKAAFEQEQRMALINSLGQGEQMGDLAYDMRARAAGLQPSSEDLMFVPDAQGNPTQIARKGSKLYNEQFTELGFYEQQLGNMRKLMDMTENPDDAYDYFRKGEIQGTLTSLVFGQARLKGQGDVGGEALSKLSLLLGSNPEDHPLMRGPISMSTRSQHFLKRELEKIRGSMKVAMSDVMTEKTFKEQAYGFNARGERVYRPSGQALPFPSEDQLPRALGDTRRTWGSALGAPGASTERLQDAYETTQPGMSLDEALERGDVGDDLMRELIPGSLWTQNPSGRSRREQNIRRSQNVETDDAWEALKKLFEQSQPTERTRRRRQRREAQQ